MPLISAHRCNTRTAVDAALALPVDYIEFDVQRCADGTFVLYHEPTVVHDGQATPVADLTYPQFSELAAASLLYTDVLNTLKDRKQAHIDLKFTSPRDRYATPAETYEAQVAALALEVLGAGNFIITSLEDRSVRTIRDWADQAGVELLVGLSLGRGLRGRPPWQMLAVRLSELFPARRYARCRANLAVVNHKLARAGVTRWAHRHRLPVLLWTLDDETTLRRAFADPRIWMLTTNFPHYAAELARTPQAN